MKVTDPYESTVEDQATVHYFPSEDNSGEALVPRLICALADIEGESPKSFDSGLRELIDLDALERLFEPTAERRGQLVLQLNRVEVRIAADGSFTIIE